MSIQSHSPAKLAAKAVSPPAGYKFVPVEPTEAMLIQACAIPGVCLEAGQRMYAAFLRAAPAIPTETGKGFSGGVKEVRSAILRIMDATEGNTNSATARDALSWCKTVAHTALDALDSIDIPAPAGGEEAVDRLRGEIGAAMDESGYGELTTSQTEAVERILAIVIQSAPDHHLRVEVESSFAESVFAPLPGVVERLTRERNEAWVEVERLRAENRRLVHKILKAGDRLVAEQKSHLDTATTAETRIAELEATLTEAVAAEREACAHTATSFLVGDPAAGIPLRNPMAHEIADRIRAHSALASSNKPVEEGR